MQRETGWFLGKKRWIITTCSAHYTVKACSQIQLALHCQYRIPFVSRTVQRQANFLNVATTLEKTQIEYKWDLVRIVFVFVSGSPCLLFASMLGFFPLALLCRNVTYMKINDFLAIPDLTWTSTRRRGVQPDASNTVSTCRSHPMTSRLCSGNPPQNGPTQPNLHCLYSHTCAHAHTCNIKRKTDHMADI